MASSQLVVLISLIAMIAMVLAAPVPPEQDSGHSSATTTMKAGTAKQLSSRDTTHSGAGTWYGVGLGSCGWDNTDSEFVAAVNSAQMSNGANPNTNPNCGKSIKINGPNGSVTAKVVDTCPTCSSGDIDLSPAAFEQIADLVDGRVAISWSWA